ncbi:MAG: hypothetical protein AAB369_03335, partial [Chloroflexota bacterium]
MSGPDGALRRITTVVASGAATDSTGQPQLALYDLDFKTTTFISDYPAGTQITSVAAIKAPKLGPEGYIYYAIIEAHHIDSYAKTAAGYAKVATIRPPIG